MFAVCSKNVCSVNYRIVWWKQSVAPTMSLSIQHFPLCCQCYAEKHVHNNYFAIGYCMVLILWMCLCCTKAFIISYHTKRCRTFIGPDSGVYSAWDFKERTWSKGFRPIRGLSSGTEAQWLIWHVCNSSTIEVRFPFSNTMTSFILLLFCIIFQSFLLSPKKKTSSFYSDIGTAC